jgi:hypothetical protein
VNRAKAITYLTVLFLAGALAGAFVGYNAGRRSVIIASPVVAPPKPPAGSNWFPRPPGPFQRENTRQRLARELELTEDQLTKIDPIITAFDQQLETMSKRNWEDLSLAISNRNERIKPFLTEEQVKKLEERMKRGTRPSGGHDNRRERRPEPPKN